MPRGGHRFSGPGSVSGRPSKGERQAILIRLPVAEADELKRLATEQGLPVGDVAGGLIRSALAHRIQCPFVLD